MASRGISGLNGGGNPASILSQLSSVNTNLESVYAELGYGKNLLGQINVADPVTLFDAKFQYDTRPITWESLTAPSWAIPYTGGIGEIDVAGTASGTFASDPYIVIGSGIVSTQTRDLVSAFENTEKILANMAGTSRVLTICAASTGVAQSMRSHMEWQEIV